jgi:hypothetical protein
MVIDNSINETINKALNFAWGEVNPSAMLFDTISEMGITLPVEEWIIW